jgi:hypothetical protein
MYTGPNIERDSLVFGYDADDRSTRYYPGEPTTNLVPYPLNEDAVGTETGNWGTDLGDGWTPNSGSVVQMENPFGDVQNILQFTNTTYGDMYAQPNYISGLNSNGITLQIGSYYVSAYFKASSEISTQNLLYRKGASGNSSVDYRTITTEWTRIGRTFDVTVAGSHNFRHYVYDAPAGFNWWTTGLQIEANDHSTQFTSSSRSSTQGLLDLTGNNTIDLSNAAFDSTAHLDFAGAQYIDTGWGNDINPTTTLFTVECIVKSDAPSASVMFFANWDQGTDQRCYFSTQSGYWRMGIQASSWSGGNVLATTDYTHILVTMDGSNANMYINGVYNYSKGYTSYTFASDFFVGTGSGGYLWDGKIPVAKIYSKVLSQQEITQNFNAYRNRFGI